MARTKKPRGSPPKPLPESIDAAPEEIAKAMLRLPADHKWHYMEDGGGEETTQLESPN